MSFGRNPHVAKAEAAEQKADSAKDGIARQQALRDAAHQWDRAADREKDGKRKQLYADKAATLRADADADAAHDSSEPADREALAAVTSSPSTATKKPSPLN
jgi:hypothetical protein